MKSENHTDISFIIPMYNAEKYIVKCIDSITESNLIGGGKCEIVIVDDGSQDNSVAIVKQMQASHPNIRLIEQANSGPGSARNHGLKHVRGKYIWFVDADDWISSNSVGIILDNLQEQYDIVRVGSVYMPSKKTDGVTERFMAVRENHIDVLDRMTAPMGPTITLFNRAFLERENLTMREGVYHEDYDFMTKAYFKARSVVHLTAPLYNIRETEGSITRSVNPRKNFDMIACVKSLQEFKKSLHKGRERRICSKYISRAINNSFHKIEYASESQQKEFQKRLSEIRFSNFLTSGNLKYVLEGVLFQVFKGRELSGYRMVISRLK